MKYSLAIRPHFGRAGARILYGLLRDSQLPRHRVARHYQAFVCHARGRAHRADLLRAPGKQRRLASCLDGDVTTK